MCVHTKNLLEPGYRRYTPVQKATLKGLCMAATWDRVPNIWKEIEGTENDVDLRRILKRYWERYHSRGLLFYNIYWEDVFIHAIRTMDFAMVSMVSFAMLMTGASMLNLMP